MEVTAVPDKKGDIITKDISITEDSVGTKILEIVAEAKSKVDLTEAKIIVAGGRGVGDVNGFRLLNELATELGAEVAGTRVAVENGWIPASRQIGQTGVTVRPELYVACGISGAIQHRAGMMDAKFIVAINKDAYAPIFKVADWGIVGDLFDVVPRLTGELQALCQVMCD
jgi:electron transfer flavoprotein alpha subunit